MNGNLKMLTVFIFSVIVVIVIIFWQPQVFAQNFITDQNQLTPPVNNLIPQPFKDLFQTFGKININISRIPVLNKIFSRASTEAQNISSNPAGLISWFKNLWERINIWLENNIGVSLREIIRAVVNVFIWILEFIIKLVKQGLSVL